MTDLLATVSAIYDDGICLLFDGQAEPSKKHYRCNASAVFSVGQRVKLAKVSGTYVVEYPVGQKGVGADPDNLAAQQSAEAAKKSAEDASRSAAAAKSHADSIKTMTVTAESYNPGSPPVYNASEVTMTVNPDGTINLHFTVPAGPRGAAGEPGRPYVPVLDRATGIMTFEPGTAGDPEHGIVLSYKAVPQRGVDYWTQADREAIIADILDILGT